MERPLPPPPEQPVLDIIEKFPEVAAWISDMTRWAGIIPDLLPRFTSYSAIINPTSVSAQNTDEQDFSVPGLNVRDVVLSVEKPTHTAGFSVAGARVSAKDTLSIQFQNVTASPIDAPSETYNIVVVR